MSNQVLDAAVVEGFVVGILISRFDEPKPIPKFHKELWELCCSDAKYVAIAAPRGFAKSTSITHSYTLASVLFRQSDYVIIISDTEGQAIQFLYDIKTELHENEVLRECFGIRKFVKETETAITVQMDDGHMFRIEAKGSGQKMRGAKWRHKRPNLIICDDLENEDVVATKDQRNKFKNWFFNAVLPAGSDSCRYRIAGTVLHFDSLLENLLANKEWKSKRYRAHAAIGDFSDLLWPEKRGAEELLKIQEMFRAEGNLDGYSSEYLNDPINTEESEFTLQDLRPMEEADYSSRKSYYAAVDFAISTKAYADYTVMPVAGIDESGVGHTVNMFRDRMGPMEIIECMFAIQERYNIEVWFAEAGAIEKVIGPFLKQEMVKRGVYLNIIPMVPVKDKKSRAWAFRARLKAGGWRFDKQAPWYPALEDEFTRFPKAKHDDIVDAHAWLGVGMQNMFAAPTDEEVFEEDEMNTIDYSGMSASCGY